MGHVYKLNKKRIIYIPFRRAANNTIKMGETSKRIYGKT